MKKHSQWIALLAIIVLLMTSIFSYEYIIDHAQHDCTGESCPICMEIATLSQNLSHYVAVPFFVLTAIFLYPVFSFCLEQWNRSLVKHTLITQKVELLN